MYIIIIIKKEKTILVLSLWHQTLCWDWPVEQAMFGMFAVNRLSLWHRVVSLCLRMAGFYLLQTTKVCARTISRQLHLLQTCTRSMIVAKKLKVDRDTASADDKKEERLIWVDLEVWVFYISFTAHPFFSLLLVLTKHAVHGLDRVQSVWEWWSLVSRLAAVFTTKSCIYYMWV